MSKFFEPGTPTPMSQEDSARAVALEARILAALTDRERPIRIDSGAGVSNIERFAEVEAWDAYCASPMVRTAARGRLAKLGIEVED